MALQCIGEVLAVNVEQVTSRDGSFDPFVSTTFVMFDGAHTTEVRAGREFPVADVEKIRSHNRPRVALGVFISKGRLYAENLIELHEARKAS